MLLFVKQLFRKYFARPTSVDKSTSIHFFPLSQISNNFFSIYSLILSIFPPFKTEVKYGACTHKRDLGHIWMCNGLFSAQLQLSVFCSSSSSSLSHFEGMKYFTINLLPSEIFLCVTTPTNFVHLCGKWEPSSNEHLNFNEKQLIFLNDNFSHLILFTKFTQQLWFC